MTTTKEREEEVAQEIGATNTHISALNGDGIEAFINDIVSKMVKTFNVEKSPPQEYVPQSQEGQCCRL